MQQGEKNNLDSAKLQACIKAQNDDAVKASVKEADGLGISATPTMYVNGEKVDGALSVDELRAIFDHALKQAGVPAPDHATTASGPAPTGTAVAK
jgi:protein-disulfide isomerase